MSGIPDAYGFEIRHVDGRVTTVQRRIDPIPVLADEAEWHRAATISLMRGYEPKWSWNGPEIPEVKPFFNGFGDDDQRRIWITRAGPGIRSEDCDEQPRPRTRVQDIRRCWRDELLIDVFAPDGRYLGEVTPPEGMRSLRGAVLRGNHVITSMLDGAGTAKVKRFRLVLPGEEEQ